MAGICHLLLVVIVVVIVGQVFLRYVMRSPTSWSEELALLLLIWYGLISVGIVVGTHGHIAIMTIRDRFPPPIRLAIDVLAQVLILVFASVMLWRAFDLIALSGRQMMPALGISRAWIYYPVLVGGALMVLNALANIVLGRLAPADTETSE